ncbi:unnamed protein product [Clavelina lepadiformis]|uniref:Small-subunit processome Utp12 domain-containing protein n=1 Tax=Clavelina lepadiformis TaxID=159417 RepID=A0ABP0G6U3_CLALP
MKFAYKFSNLLGTVYRKGNIEFMKDGNTVLSPVGNRVTLFDLKSNNAETLPFTTQCNIACLAIAPDGCTAILIDEEGEASLVSLLSKSILHTHHFRKPIQCIKYSPDGKKFAVTKDNLVLVYHAPGKSRVINPFQLYRTFYGAYGETTSIDWTTDSRAFAVGGKDMNTRVYAAIKCDNLIVYSLGGHKDEIVGCYFEKESLDLYTVSRDGALNVWECDTDLENLHPADEEEVLPYSASVDEIENKDKAPETRSTHTESQNMDVEGKEKILYHRLAKYFFNKEGNFNNVTSTSFHKDTHILVTGFASGSFHIHELPDFNLIHSLSISDHQITSASFNFTGDWLALASSTLGQLLVWDWQSESYIMKQQGHFSNMLCLDYSPDGRYIATGGEDGKIKVWDTSSSFCFVTFSEHSAGVTGVQFTSSGQVIMSASLDGTVRAFDLHRYRNFRTFTSPRPTQFASLAVDSSGELVSAGSKDTFEVFVWSVRTGRLLDLLTGHEAPVVSLSFSSTSSLLASGSWDQTVTLWKIGEEKGARESVDVGHDVMSVSFRPDGGELAVSTLNAEITFWNVQTMTQTGSIDCRHDIGGGRGELDRVSAKTSSFGKSFQTLCYTADGESIIAGGQTKNVCVYHVREGLLMKKFEVTRNLSFDAVEEFLDKRKMTEFGPSAMIEMGEGEEGTAIKLPGVRSGDMSSRFYKPEIRVSCVRFSPTGREWAAVTTEGLLIYSLDANFTFDPFDLDIDITPENIRKEIKNKEYSKSIMMSFRLNQTSLINEVFEQVPVNNIEIISRNLPDVYVEKLLTFIASKLERSPHLHFYLLWCRALLLAHGPALKARAVKVMALMANLQKALTRKAEEVTKVCDNNYYQIEYIKALAIQRRIHKVTEQEVDLKSDDEISVLSMDDT